MTPLESGGRNGGAGLVATSLVTHLSALAPEWHFTLLTSADSHAELAALDASNVQRRCVLAPAKKQSPARRAADTLLPTGVLVRLKRLYWAFRTASRYRRIADELSHDLLLCPFTVPYFWRAGVPTVSIVYDLQHLTYPQFFSAEQRWNRQAQLQDVCTRAAHVMCISDYVRGTLVASLVACAERAEAVPLGLLQESPEPDVAVLDRLGLGGAAFLLYPANFWPHKNHRRLFEALRLYLQTPSAPRLKLVCTGAPNALMHELQAYADGLVADTVVFAGYVRPAELTALVDASLGVIFPSLYEGFGMPVLEAMGRGKPVLCSNVTSLPEVAGDAALYFDPTDVAQIAAAIRDIAEDPRQSAAMVRRGYDRVVLFGDARDMAERYLASLRRVLAASAV